MGHMVDPILTASMQKAASMTTCQGGKPKQHEFCNCCAGSCPTKNLSLTLLWCIRVGFASSATRNWRNQQARARKDTWLEVRDLLSFADAARADPPNGNPALVVIVVKVSHQHLQG